MCVCNSYHRVQICLYRSLTNAQASFFTNGLSQVCAMPPFALCNVSEFINL